MTDEFTAEKYPGLIEADCWTCAVAKFSKAGGIFGETAFLGHPSMYSKCGNKRCPCASHHDNICTGSNEPGQPGSAYPAFDHPVSFEELRAKLSALDV